MRDTRIFLGCAVVLIAASAGPRPSSANPLPGCDWENGETVIGFDGTGLVAVNAMAPEAQPYSEHAVQLQLVHLDDPAPAAHIAHLWNFSSGEYNIWFSTYLEQPASTGWSLQGRWDTGSAEPAWSMAIPPHQGWADFMATFTLGSEADGLILAIAPTETAPGAIWIDMLLVFGDNSSSYSLQTPCWEVVGTEAQSFGSIKALFR